jgi:maltose alpha-D-glucosyltransferase/alpha-amylase
VVNVADQRRDRGSLLTWIGRILRVRRECPEISWGTCRIVRTEARDVLVLRYDWRGAALVTLHNFTDRSRPVALALEGPGADLLVDVFDHQHSRAGGEGAHVITLPPYGYRWLRVGAADSTLDRRSF